MPISWVLKKDGTQEEFDLSKLIHSLQKAGAPLSLAKEVAEEIRDTGQETERSSEILERALELLEKREISVAIKYRLKRALMELGPAGFVFEAYLEKIFQELGYKTQRDVILQGRCVSHEIDVLAEKEGEKIIVEAKYHNQGGTKTDVKVAMMVWARFEDLKVRGISRAWLVTNTKLTTQAQRYAECVGLTAVGWNYPHHNSLKKIIEETGLYPITVLPHLNKQAFKILSEKNIITLKDLLSSEPELLAQKVGLKKEYLIHLYKIAKLS